MLKRLLEKYIQKTKNKDFHFDPALTSGTLFFFALNKFFSLIRGLKLYNFSKRGLFVYCDAKVKLISRNKIQVGSNINIGRFACLSGLGKQGITLGSNVNIGSSSQLIVSASLNHLGDYIHIGDNVGLGEFAYIGGAGGTKIGRDTIIGQYLSVHPENHNFQDTEQPIRLQGVTRKGVIIGENCWIGAKVTILDGVEIGNGCIVAAGAVVTQSFPRKSLIGGVPAKIIREL